MSLASELLIGLSIEELEALADGKLAPAAQGRLDEFLAKRKAQSLTVEEEAELDSLLKKSDQLTILTTRARYTLSQVKKNSTRITYHVHTSPKRKRGSRPEQLPRSG